MLKGLEINEIKFSQLNSVLRFDSEYFKKEDLSKLELLRKAGTTALRNVASVTDGIHTSIDYDQSGNIKLLSATSPRDNYLDTSRTVFISQKQNELNPRSALREGDVILSTVGTIGNCAVIQSADLPANTDRHVAIIRVTGGFSPYYLSTFLLSKYGRLQTKRETTGNVQPNLFLYKINELLIPLPLPEHKKIVEEKVKQGLECLRQAQHLYEEAEKCLLRCLGITLPKTSNQIVQSIKSLKDSFLTTGRLDAEYYQPQYDNLLDQLNQHLTKRLDNIVKIKKSIEPGSQEYKDKGVPFLRVSDLTKFGLLKPSLHLDPVNYSNVIHPKKNTILLSKDGSVGIAYKTEQNIEVITSGAILHLNIFDKEIDPDYLTLVLNSSVVQMQVQRAVGGSIIQHWKIADIQNTVIPILPKPNQNNISENIRKSFDLRKKAFELFEDARKMVEIQIKNGFKRKDRVFF